MRTKILFFTVVSFLFTINITIAQSTNGNYTNNNYISGYYLGWGATSGDLLFKVNNNTQMTLQNTTGYLGIGNPSPLYKLHVTAIYNGWSSVIQNQGCGIYMAYGNSLTDGYGMHIRVNNSSVNRYAFQIFNQLSNGTPNNIFHVTNSGKVGINIVSTGVVSSLDATLDIKLAQTEPYYNKAAAFRGKNNDGTLYIVPNDISGGYNWIAKEGDIGIFYTDNLDYGSKNLNAGFVLAPGRECLGGIRLDNMGRVGINTSAIPTQYTLAVNGTIGARELVIETTTWADYVFDKEYNLPTLNDVELFINNNKHLPDVPSACEAIENGISVGEMNKVLLKKVEELYLYVIQQQKEIEELKKK